MNCKIFLLGPFQAALAGRPLDHFDTAKTRALLAYMAVEEARPHRREALAELLWPGSPGDAALRNLRLTLHRLKRAFGEAGAQAAPGEEILLFPDRQAIQLNLPEVVWTDVHAFVQAAENSKQHAHASPVECAECTGLLEQAVLLYRGEFLEGFSLRDSFEFDEWVLLRRERYRQYVLEALDQLTSHYLWKAELVSTYEERQAALTKARAYTLRSLAIEPWREIAHRQHMRALAMNGQVQEALMQYEVCRQMLEEEFGIAPDPLTTRMHQQIRERAVSGWPAFSIENRQAPNNLLPQLTPLIGREAQLARLERLLSSYRWVTLVGEGGIGKTRLALTAAEKALPRYPDGVWVVPLAESGHAGPAGEPDDPAPIHGLLAKAIADVLHFKFREGLSPVQQLHEFLRAKKLLLILDSFEHLSPGADFLIDLLTHAPGIHLMVTTRQTLHFQAGYIMRLDGLPVPEQEDDPQGGEYPAVQLFAERVERLSGYFRLDEEKLPLVIRICQLLDGVPLAIELAAPWALRCSLDEIVNSIQTDLDFLSSTMVGAPERHRSMRAVFESSWQLLTPAEQRVFASCATMGGVFVSSQVEGLPGDVQDVLEALVDKMMVLRVSPGRYRIHDTLRQFARDQTPGSEP